MRRSMMRMRMAIKYMKMRMIVIMRMRIRTGTGTAISTRMITTWKSFKKEKVNDSKKSHL